MIQPHIHESAEPHADGSGQLIELQRLIKEQSRQLKKLAAQVEALSSREADLRAKSAAAEERLLRRQEQAQAGLYDLQDNLFGPVGMRSAQPTGYRQLIRQVREIVRTSVPQDARIIVVSKGDNELLDLYSRPAWHFPRAFDGAYAGYYPADSGAAIAQLEALRSQGADYLLFPSPALWWLEYYTGFKQHLDRRYGVVVRQPDTCVMYALRARPESGVARMLAECEEIFAGYQNRFERTPTVLDWDSGLDLAANFPEHIIASRPNEDGRLPYLDDSIDLVFVASIDPPGMAEAQRVAHAGVVMPAATPTGAGPGQGLAVNWKLAGNGRKIPMTSIIIPTYSGIRYTETCLAALRETLPGDFPVEIIVVDDGSTDETQARLKDLGKLDKRLKVLRNRKNAGFIASCNRAAGVSTGEIIVFLNNDTVPLPGWFEPLLQTFRNFPDAGAVGGKLIYPDGRLQEAGVLIFSDGSATHPGRTGHEIDAPLFNYVREVDYCSGALLATRRRLFAEVGGFDARYSPAYYEDTDYCFSVRARGYRVYYQPESAIIHFEGGTSGRDLSNGAKRFQRLNRSKFIEKWKVALRRQPPRPNKFDQDTWYSLAVRDGAEGVGEP